MKINREGHTPNQRVEKHYSIYTTVWINNLYLKAYKNTNGHLCWILIYAYCLDSSPRLRCTQSDIKWCMVIFSVALASSYLLIFSVGPACDSLLFFRNLLITITSNYDIMGLISMTDWWTNRHGHKQGLLLWCNYLWLIKTLIFLPPM